jgi:peptide deformylase
MAIRAIITIPNKCLYKKTEKVKQIDQTVVDIAKDLIDTVRVAKDPEGAGLAATQIGISKRMCVVRNFFKDPQNPDKILSNDIVL